MENLHTRQCLENKVDPIYNVKRFPVKCILCNILLNLFHKDHNVIMIAIQIVLPAMVAYIKAEVNAPEVPVSLITLFSLHHSFAYYLNLLCYYYRSNSYGDVQNYCFVRLPVSQLTPVYPATQ